MMIYLMNYMLPIYLLLLNIILDTYAIPESWGDTIRII